MAVDLYYDKAVLPFYANPAIIYLNRTSPKRGDFIPSDWLSKSVFNSQGYRHGSRTGFTFMHVKYWCVDKMRPTTVKWTHLGGGLLANGQWLMHHTHKDYQTLHILIKIFADGVFVSELICSAWVCSKYKDFPVHGIYSGCKVRDILHGNFINFLLVLGHSMVVIQTLYTNLTFPCHICTHLIPVSRSI